MRSFGHLVGHIGTTDRALAPADLGSGTSAASEATRAANAAVLDALPFDDVEDFEFAARGFIATLEDPVIRAADGRVVSDLSAYAFLDGPAPPTANPSLWRQAQLLTRHGLFEVVDGVYQVRGFDISIITFIRGDSGWIVVDPLTTAEAAAAAYGLVKQHLADLPVVAVIYSHSHADHFGGVRGVVEQADVEAGRVRVIAPEGFLEHAVSENIIAGNAMSRRATFQFGQGLEQGPEGELTSGLGPAVSRGTLTLIAPTETVSFTGEELTIDGVLLEFQMTPGAEAPSEMNFFMPGHNLLFLAENANATMHNLLPLRGALVRDAKAWADYLTESIRRYAERTDTMCAAHFWPRWGRQAIDRFLRTHRDAYKYLHDQTVRLMNAGLTGIEIAECLDLPPPLARQFYNRGYYGTMSHNTRAVYQRYMGWYDGNPASLNPLPPEALGPRYVEAMGGAEAVLARAKTAAEAADYRWAAQLLNHLVFADPQNATAKDLLAAVYRQMGFQAESGVWRNVYLTGARELTNGVAKGRAHTVPFDMIRATTTPMLLDFLSVRINGERARGHALSINLDLTDFRESHLISLANSALVHEAGITDPAASATLRLRRADFLGLIFGLTRLDDRMASGDVVVEGDVAAVAALLSLVDPLDPHFNVVTP